MYENLSISEVENLRVEKEKELCKAQDNLHNVEIEELTIAKEIILLQVKRKDLQMSISKARQVIRNINLEIKILTSTFWSKRA